jgi:hypothetical protein
MCQNGAKDPLELWTRGVIKYELYSNIVQKVSTLLEGSLRILTGVDLGIIRYEHHSNYSRCVQIHEQDPWDPHWTDLCDWLIIKYELF